MARIFLRILWGTAFLSLVALYPAQLLAVPQWSEAEESDGSSEKEKVTTWEEILGIGAIKFDLHDPYLNDALQEAIKTGSVVVGKEGDHEFRCPPNTTPLKLEDGSTVCAGVDPSPAYQPPGTRKTIKFCGRPQGIPETLCIETHIICDESGVCRLRVVIPSIVSLIIGAGSFDCHLVPDSSGGPSKIECKIKIRDKDPFTLSCTFEPGSAPTGEPPRIPVCVACKTSVTPGVRRYCYYPEDHPVIPEIEPYFPGVPFRPTPAPSPTRQPTASPTATVVPTFP